MKHTHTHTQLIKRSPITHLINKKRGDEFSWLEDVNHSPDKIIVGRLGEVGFKADVGELRFWGDVNSPVCSLDGGRERGRKEETSHMTPKAHVHRRAT